jgi:hypothetical protein
MNTHDKGITISPVIYSSGGTVTPERSVLFLSKQNNVQATAEADKSQKAYNMESLLMFKVLLNALFYEVDQKEF